MPITKKTPPETQSWQRLILNTNSAQAEAISDWLSEEGALSVILEGADAEEIFMEELNKIQLWKTTTIKAVFSPDFLRESVERGLIEAWKLKSADWEWETFLEENWEKSYRQHFSPQCFGEKIWVCPTWIKLETTLPILWLDPGLAFGTGTHPTTRLCLDALAHLDLKEKTVVDYGCGSGILALAAVHLGAKKVYAVDHDPQALEATQKNAALNKIFNLESCLPENLPTIKTDVLVANIFAPVLINLSSTFIALLKKEGVCILSGILEEQSGMVKEHYQKFFIKTEEKRLEEWARLEFAGLF